MTTNPSFGKRVPLSVTPIMKYAHSYLLSDKGGEGTQFDWTALLIKGLFLCYERKRLLIETDNDGSHVADIKEIYENIAERIEIDVNDLIKEINDCLKSLNMI